MSTVQGHVSSFDPQDADLVESIKSIVIEHGRLTIQPDKITTASDLYDAGMTSFASVNVMLALENAFDIEFPDRMLKRTVFESIGSMAAAIEELQES